MMNSWAPGSLGAPSCREVPSVTQLGVCVLGGEGSKQLGRERKLTSLPQIVLTSSGGSKF